MLNKFASAKKMHSSRTRQAHVHASVIFVSASLEGFKSYRGTYLSDIFVIIKTRADALLL